MEVQVLGKSPAWPDAGGACSGYLVRHEDYTLLLDCGSGVVGKLREVLELTALDAILISHLHPDHYLDLVPLSYAVRFSPRLRGAGPLLLPLHAPPGATDAFRRLSACFSRADHLESSFMLAEYDPDRPLALGPLTARFREVPHYTRAHAIELTAAGRRFTFGADCAPNDALVTFARDTDLIMLEATLTEPEPESEGERGHMTPFEAGALARRASARRVVLTHFTDEVDGAWIAAEGASGYGAPVELARSGARYGV